MTDDNGTYSFLVRYNKTHFAVFEPNPDLLERAFEDGDAKTAFVRVVLECAYKRVFVGASHTSEQEDGKTPSGNTMLFEVDDGRYVCVSQDVVSFKPPEPILKYESPIHGSDVPYPYAVGAKASYLVLARTVVPHADLQHEGQDPYEVAYQKGRAKKPPIPGLKVLRKRRYFAAR